MDVIIATEDALSEAVVRRLLGESNQAWSVTAAIRKNGYGYLKSKLDGLVKTSSRVPVLMLTDLDLKPCAPELIRQWFGERCVPPGLLFRVAIHEVESWLLADHDGISDFLGIPIDRLPSSPDDLQDPKGHLLHLVRSYSPRAIKVDLLPAPRALASVGIGYNSVLVEFSQNHWDPSRAAQRSDSLSRAIRRIGRNQ
jgi:hypothetical protein